MRRAEVGVRSGRRCCRQGKHLRARQVRRGERLFALPGGRSPPMMTAVSLGTTGMTESKKAMARITSRNHHSPPTSSSHSVEVGDPVAEPTEEVAEDVAEQGSAHQAPDAIRPRIQRGSTGRRGELLESTIFRCRAVSSRSRCATRRGRSRRQAARCGEPQPAGRSSRPALRGATALTTSLPRRTPPSITTSTWSPTVSAIVGQHADRGGRTVEVVATMVRHRDRRDAGIDRPLGIIDAITPLSMNGPPHCSRSQATSSQVGGGVCIHLAVRLEERRRAALPEVAKLGTSRPAADPRPSPTQQPSWFGDQRREGAASSSATSMRCGDQRAAPVAGMRERPVEWSGSARLRRPTCGPVDAGDEGVAPAGPIGLEEGLRLAAITSSIGLLANELSPDDATPAPLPGPRRPHRRDGPPGRPSARSAPASRSLTHHRRRHVPVAGWPATTGKNQLGERCAMVVDRRSRSEPAMRAA